MHITKGMHTTKGMHITKGMHTTKKITDTLAYCLQSPKFMKIY